MADKDHLILTAIGPDQVGLVARISEFVTGNGCNIEDSKMAVFCGEFAVIVLISGEPSRLSGIRQNHGKLESETGLAVTVKTPAPSKAAGPSRPYKLMAYCMDHPGVVYRISDVLSSCGINILSMETKTYAAPESGTALFQLEAHLALPPRVDINQLRDRFSEIQSEENIDIDLTAMPSPK